MSLSARDRVTLFEADTRLGGHAHTHYLDSGDGLIVGVDSAFLVHNDRTYPTLCRLFDELGVATTETDMSMSVRDDVSGLEYAGARGIGGLFPSLATLARPRYLRMLAEVKRFHRGGHPLARQRMPTTRRIGAFLERHRFSPYFVDNFMTPLVAAVWSCPPGDAMRYPAGTCSSSSSTTACCRCSARRAGAPSPAARRPTSKRSSTRIAEVRAGTPVRSVRRVPGGVAVTADEGRGISTPPSSPRTPTRRC